MKVLMVLAHPDDEVLWSYPIIQTKEHDVSLITLSDNKERHGDGPIKALKEVCVVNNINLIDTERVANNFYRIAPRFEAKVLRDIISLFRGQIEKAYDSLKPDYIFTHNPMGEYGHGDHRFVFNLVSSSYDKLCLTDICLGNSCHLSTIDKPQFYSKNLFREAHKTHHKLNIDWYHNMKSIYDKHNAWTWGGHDSVNSCFLNYFN